MLQLFIPSTILDRQIEYFFTRSEGENTFHLKKKINDKKNIDKKFPRDNTIIIQIVYKLLTYKE